MSLTLQLVLGVILVFSTCSSTTGTKYRRIRQVEFYNSTTSTTEHATPTTENVTLSTGHITPSITEHVAPSTTEHAAPSSTEHVTASSTEHVTPSSTEHVGPSTTEHIAPSSTETVTTSSTEHVTPSSTEHVAPSATEHVAPSSTEAVTDSSTEHVTSSSTEHVAPFTTEHVAPSTPQNVAAEKIYEQVKLIEKPPKTDTELKVNTQKNSTSIELNKSESYLRIPDLIPEEDRSQHEEHKNAVENEQYEENRENVIKQDSSEKNREDNSRSIDVDIKPFITPEFRNKNNVFAAPISSDTEKYYDNVFEPKPATGKLVDFSNLELTTPRSEFFDNKFKEAMQSIGQKLEHIDVEENDEEDEDMSEMDTKDMPMDKLIDEYKTTPNSNLDYKEMKNVVKHNDGDKDSMHKDMIVEHVKHINFESSFNDTTTYNEDTLDEKQPRGEADHLGTTTPKNNFIFTTRKATSLTKPPVNRNTSYILSNSIETDTLKAINIVTTQLPISTSRSKGDMDGTMDSRQYSTERNNRKEQSVEENIISASTPRKYEKTTTEIVTTTIIDENLTPMITEYKTEESTTTKEDVTTAAGSTANIETTQATTTESLSEIISTTTEGTTTEALTAEPTITMNMGYTEDLFSVKDDLITTSKEELTSTMVEDLKLFESTPDQVSTQQADEFSTTFSDDEKTTETVPRTTETVFRTSRIFKDFNTTTETVTEAIGTTESFTESTTFENTTPEIIIIDTTTHAPTTTTDAATTTQKIVTIAPTLNITMTEISKYTDEYPNETVEDRIHISTTVPPTSTVEFVHIESVNGSQTTLLPETLNPNLNYPNPETDKPVKNRKTGEESMIINTTPDGVDTPSTENSIIEPPGDGRGTVAAIVISSVGAVCLVLLAGLLYIMRKRQKRFNYGQRCRPVGLDDYSMDNVSVYNSVRRKGVLRQSKRSYGNPAFDDPVAVTHPLNFPALATFTNNTEEIKAEFEEIPQIVARTSELPDGCETKNRYANVIPLPESRVFLKPIDGYANSDYINANYVTGPKNTKGYYIACQAPLQNTVDDFWRMVWEQQSKVILMITHLFENGVEKSVDYLPPSEVLDCHRLFGDFQVTLKKREVKDKYIISSLQLKNMVSNSWRDVTHFWYMGWPEKGVPSEGNSLIAFLIEARSFMKTATLDKNAAVNGNIQNGSATNEVNPVAVHCSPGTGRTGVVIACDIAIREFEQTRLVDIPKIVYRIRRDRASAVQTKEQYMFIYKVISLYATKLTGGALDTF